MYKHFFKRFLDFALSLIGIIVISPIFVFLWICLTITNKGAGAFFIQARPGRNEKIFKVIKFKTMNDKRDKLGLLLPDSARLTRIGRFIRSTSLDEIPQLLNVIKGDMSLIGPRPLKTHNLLLYSREQARRHDVRPGITGWAQINGRNNLLLSKKFEYDVWYVDNISFSLDLKILLRTIIKVFKKDDIGNGADSMVEVDDLGFMDKLQELKKHNKI